MSIKKRSIFRMIWFWLVACFFVWQWSTFQSRNLPEDTFENDSRVTVEDSEDQITFRAQNPENKVEIIFLQGGLTDPKAYAPLCRKMAKRGLTCHLMKMDWRMPIWNYEKIEDLFDLKGGNYILGGHSQGAKMAAQFVHENPGLMKGLFLLGTSHPRDYDLSDRTIPTVKLYGELDGLASVPEVMENKDKLPQNTELIEVMGGNHSQFGYLGVLFTDNKATISLEEQQAFTANTLINFFKKVEAELPKN